MRTFESSRSIDDTASDWAARIDREPLTPAQDADLTTWLQADPRHPGALLRAQAIVMKSQSAQALGAHFDPSDFVAPDVLDAPPRRPGLSRRSLIWTGSAVAGAALVAVGVAAPAAGTTISTAKGERRTVPLKDGASVMLNTDTSLRIHEASAERHVTVLKGEAFFAVAPGRASPLVVEVGGRNLTTGQAAFGVRKLGDVPVELFVREGRVTIGAPFWSGQREIAVGAGTRLAFGERSLFAPSAPEQLSSVSPEAMQRSLAWLQGNIAFQGETLEAAASSFARYADTTIEIRDPGLAREPVTGLFAANDPAGFSRAVAAIFDARVEQRGGRIILTRGASPR